MSQPIVLLLSGPNLNLLGERQPEVYGTTTLEDHVVASTTVASARGLALEHVQSNHEGSRTTHGPSTMRWPSLMDRWSNSTSQTQRRGSHGATLRWWRRWPMGPLPGSVHWGIAWLSPQ